MRKYLVAIAVAFMALFLTTPIAFASPPVDPGGVIKPNDTLASVQISAATVTFLLATVIPIVVGLLTKLSSKYKGALMILLVAIVAAIVTATIADGTAVFSQQTLEVFIKGLVGAYGSYYGLLKPAGITSSSIRVPGDTPGSVLSIPGSLASKGLT